MTLTGKEARSKALAKRPVLKRISAQLSALVAELEIPTPEQFEAMRRRQSPWTPEAYYAALLRNTEFYVDQARVLIHEKSNHTARSLKALYERHGAPSPSLERSLRYLVEDRSGVSIPPSEAETLCDNPQARVKLAAQMLFSALAQFCGRLTDPDDEETAVRRERDGEPQ